MSLRVQTRLCIVVRNLLNGVHWPPVNTLPIVGTKLRIGLIGTIEWTVLLSEHLHDTPKRAKCLFLSECVAHNAMGNSE